MHLIPGRNHSVGLEKQVLQRVSPRREAKRKERASIEKGATLKRKSKPFLLERARLTGLVKGEGLKKKKKKKALTFS